MANSDIGKSQGLRRDQSIVNHSSMQVFYVAIFSIAMITASCGGGSNSGTGSSQSGGTGPTGGSGGNAITIQHVEPSLVMLGIAVGSVTLAGTNFTASSTVLFDGASVPTFYSGASSLQFQLPDSTINAAKSHMVQVSDPANGKSNVATYQVYAPQPGPALFAGQLTQYMSESLITHSLVPDLNGDGRADLILVTLDSTTSQYVPVVRYGQADGTFSASTSLGSFTPLVSPGEVLAGDFNGDGHTDLILIGGGGDSQSSYQVLLNDGTGKFSSASTGTLPTTTFLAPAVIGDFNHDGKLDFAYGTASNGQAFSLFFGNGDGTFAAPVSIGASGGETSVASAADLNGDGYTDLVYLDANASQIHILLSGPGGSFTDSRPAGLPSPTAGFVVADFNNDHVPDIFAINSANMGQAYLGAGNGTFTATGSPILAFDGFLTTMPFVAGDFDNDGNMDFATRTALSGPDEILFLFGDGKGNFTRQSIVSDQSFTLEVGDVNGDGIADIFAGVDPGFAYPSVVLGRSDRNFPSPQILFPNTWGTLSAGNILNNGFTDLLVAGAGDGTFGSVPGTIYQIQSNGTFAAQGEAPEYPTLLVDLNGDGIPDMVGFSGTTLLIWKGDGSGIYQSPINQISLSVAFSPIYFRDMDGDGNMDIVLPGAILYGKGNFQFDVVSIPLYQNFAVGDFDGDGIPDIATGSGVMFGQGNRTFTSPMGSSPLPDNPPAFPTEVVADINRDGMDDLVIGESGPAIYLSVGRQGFVLDQLLMINGYAVSASSVAVADLNEDGLPDLAVGMLGGDDIVLFTNDGTGKYEVTSYAIGLYSVCTLAGDFNHDGKPDLAFLTYTQIDKPNSVTMLLHQ